MNSRAALTVQTDRGLSLQSNLPYSTEEIDILIRILKDISNCWKGKGKGTAEEMTPTWYVIVLGESDTYVSKIDKTHAHSKQLS